MHHNKTDYFVPSAVIINNSRISNTVREKGGHGKRNRESNRKIEPDRKSLTKRGTERYQSIQERDSLLQISRMI